MQMQNIFSNYNEKFLCSWGSFPWEKENIYKISFKEAPWEVHTLGWSLRGPIYSLSRILLYFRPNVGLRDSPAGSFCLLNFRLSVRNTCLCCLHHLKCARLTSSWIHRVRDRAGHKHTGARKDSPDICHLCLSFLQFCSWVACLGTHPSHTISHSPGNGKSSTLHNTGFSRKALFYKIFPKI